VSSKPDENKTPKIDKKPFIQKFLDNFRPTPISQGDETEFDICMKCGRRMPDRKLSTLREHQENAHPMSSKEKRSAFVYKHMLISLLGLVVVVVAGLSIIPDFFIDEETESIIDVEVCTEKTIALKTKIWQQGEFLPSNAEDLNYLMLNCNASFWSYKHGGTIFDSDYYSPEKIAERESSNGFLTLPDVRSVGGEN